RNRETASRHLDLDQGSAKLWGNRLGAARDVAMLSAAFIWGIMLGLGSSLHCAGMCGPIGCSLLLMGDGRESRLALALRLGAMQLGRIAAYGGLGLGFGLLGAGLYARADFSGLHG